MSNPELMKSLEAPDRGHPEMGPGDTVKVHVRVVEGDRERIQVFQGIVIRLRGGGNGDASSGAVSSSRWRSP